MEVFLQYLPIIAIFVIMIGMTAAIRVSVRKQKKRMEDLNNSLRAGIKVRTAGGFLGTIVGVNEDTVYVELNPDKTKVELLKGAVAPLDEAPAPAEIPAEPAPQEKENVTEKNDGTEE